VDMIYLSRLGDGELFLNGPRVPAAAARTLARTDALLEAATEEAAQIRTAAHEEGYAAGFAQGQGELADVLCKAHAKTERAVRELEPVIADCVVHAVRVLIGEVEQSRLMERAVLHVRERLQEASGLVLRVPPSRAAAAQAAVARLASDHALLLPVRVAVDALLHDDDCVIESSLGRAECGLEHQLSRLRESVAQALAGVELPQ
jgi:type III secretion protein L